MYEWGGLSAKNERPYGPYRYKEALLKQGIRLGGMLTNVETWISVTKAEFKRLTIPFKMLQQHLPPVWGNPSKVVICMKMNGVPTKFVLMGGKEQICWSTYYMMQQAPT